jgi:acyl carrier protein
MQISENDLWILSYYRESELAGALVMGRLARETDDDELRVNLTEHCAEEAHHAWLWTQTILAVGGTPRRVSETYQSRYYAAVGTPASMLEVLALTQVFEKRVIRHFRAHLRWPNVHPRVAETLRRMIEDEVGHISWVKDRLDRYAAELGAHVVAETMRRYEEIDRQVYAGMLEYRERAQELLDGAPRAPARGAGEVAARVNRVVAKALGVVEANLRPEASLRDLGVDSLDLVVLVMAIEEEFQVELEPSAAGELKTLADLTARLVALTAAGPSPGAARAGETPGATRLVTAPARGEAA